MNYYPLYDDAAATTPWCYSGEAPAIIATAGDTCSFADLMIPGYSTDDLFELAWEQEEAGAGASASKTPPPAASCLWSPPPEVRHGPPSEDEMAAWLCAIVRGDELFNVNEDVPEERPTSDDTSVTTTDKNEKLPMTEEGMGSTKKEMRKPRAAGTSRSHHGQAHKLTEKRRRHKINERFRTLRQLVPGCDDKSNQAATLDKTIEYMKSLQHHVQYQYNQAVPPPVAVPMPAAPAMVLVPAPTMVVPLGAMLQLPGFPAPAVSMMMMPTAAAAPLYPAAAAAPGGAGHRQGWSSSKGKGGSIRSLRPKH